MNAAPIRGFSLIEALACLMLVCILLSIATASWAMLIQQQREQTATFELLNTLNYARSKAINLNNMISLCAGQTNCNDDLIWQQQLLIFSDRNGNGQIDPDDTLLKAIELASAVTWEWSNFRNKPYLTFRPNGATHSLNGTFTLCHSNRTIKLNLAGRSRLETNSSSDSCSP